MSFLFRKQRLQGPVGLLFTSSPPSITLPWFQSYSASSYLRGGQISPKTVVLNKGPVQTASTEIGGQSPDLETLSHSIEPQLRKLGMPTELKMGVPTLLRDFDVARVGKVVSTENVSREGMRNFWEEEFWKKESKREIDRVLSPSSLWRREIVDFIGE